MDFFDIVSVFLCFFGDSHEAPNNFLEKVLIFCDLCTWTQIAKNKHSIHLLFVKFVFKTFKWNTYQTSS